MTPISLTEPEMQEIVSASSSVQINGRRDPRYNTNISIPTTEESGYNSARNSRIQNLDPEEGDREDSEENDEIEMQAITACYSKNSVASLPAYQTKQLPKSKRPFQSEPNPNNEIESAFKASYGSSSNESISSNDNFNPKRQNDRRKKGNAAKPSTLDLYPEPNHNQRETKKLHKRVLILDEMLDTEKNYVDILRILLEEFKKTSVGKGTMLQLRNWTDLLQY